MKVLLCLIVGTKVFSMISTHLNRSLIFFCIFYQLCQVEIEICIFTYEKFLFALREHWGRAIPQESWAEGGEWVKNWWMGGGVGLCEDVEGKSLRHIFCPSATSRNF